MLAVAPASAGAETINQTIPAEDFFSTDPETPFVNLCNGELLGAEGDVHVVGRLNRDPDGPDYRGIHLNTQGVAAVGLTTGTRYSVTEVGNTILNANPGAASVTTVVFTLDVISHGSGENFRAVDIVHFTVNANGEPTATVTGGHADCRLAA